MNLTTDEVAARLRCDEWTVRRLCASGDLRASKVAQRWLVSEADLEAYLDATSTKPRKRRARAS